MELIEALRRLAEIDEEWDAKAHRYQTLRDRLSDDTLLRTKRTEQKRLEETLASARGQLHDLELELEGLQAQAKQVEQDLYGGTITSPRELENLHRDAEYLKRRIGQLEEEILALMERVDTLSAAAAQGANELQAFEQQWNKEMQSTHEEYLTLRARLESLRDEREHLRSLIPRRELALYDELRRSKGGKPLAPMRDRVCLVCHVSVPSYKAAIVEEGGDAIATCEGCGRILYLA